MNFEVQIIFSKEFKMLLLILKILLFIFIFFLVKIVVIKLLTKLLINELDKN